MMLNEAAFCLQENILQNPTDGDLGAILGLGFPPFLGGPFKYMDTLGIRQVVEIMETLASEYGPRFSPAPILRDMAKTNGSFYE